MVLFIEGPRVVLFIEGPRVILFSEWPRVVLFSVLAVSVSGCLSVNTITCEPLEISSQNFFRASSDGQKGGQVRRWLLWGARVVRRCL